MGKFSPLFFAIFRDSIICGTKCVGVTKLILFAPLSCNSKNISDNLSIVISVPNPSLDIL